MQTSKVPIYARLKIDGLEQDRPVFRKAHELVKDYITFHKKKKRAYEFITYIATG